MNLQRITLENDIKSLKCMLYVQEAIYIGENNNKERKKKSPKYHRMRVNNEYKILEKMREKLVKKQNKLKQILNRR